jgi:hypothetical protein
MRQVYVKVAKCRIENMFNGRNDVEPTSLESEISNELQYSKNTRLRPRVSIWTVLQSGYAKLKPRDNTPTCPAS